MNDNHQTTNLLSAEEMRQYLTFRLQEQEFGIEILRVQEIKGFAAVTPIPNVPACVKGVMNLRGTVIPVIDLRAKFNMPAEDYNQFTVIIITNVGDKMMGLVVDAVSDVLNVGQDEFAAKPELGSAVDTAFIIGMAKSNDRLITLLDIQELLSNEQRMGQAA